MDDTDSTSPDAPVATIGDYLHDDAPLLGDALRALADEHTTGLWFEETFTPWSEVVAAASARIGAFRALLDGSDGPPHVGVLLENTPEFLAALDAAACSEIVVAGLNSTRRGEALARDVRLADCRVVLTDAAHAPLLTGDLGGARVVRVDSDEWTDLLAAHAGAALPDRGSVPVGTDDLVVLVYTSGTSGDPKAVRVTQAKISVPGLMLAERFGIGSGDCVYSAMPLFHSNAVMVAWPIAVFAGCSIALRRRFSASGWLGDVRRYGCTFANYVGTPLTYVLATPERPDDADNPVRTVYGNEAPARVRTEFARRFGVRVVDGFGSTEGGVSVTRTPDTPDSALGRFAPGTSILHPGTGEPCPPAEFDDTGRLVNAEDATGELVSDGPGLFAGYYGDPAADAERMRGGRFHTGDLAYADAEGFVYFAGRSSGWLRVDGENLGAAPIERILLRHERVAEAAVYALPAAGTGDRVAAALVLRTGGDSSGPSADEVVAGLADFLAAQPDLGPKQWPSVVRVCTGLPRTASFKVMTRRLVERGTGPAEGPDWVWLREGPAPGPFERLV